MLPIRSSAFKYVYLPTNCELLNMTCLVDIFIHHSALAGRDSQRDNAKKTSYCILIKVSHLQRLQILRKRREECEERLGT